MLVFLAIAAAPASGADPADLSSLLQKASDAYHRDHDPQKAADLYNKAVDA